MFRNEALKISWDEICRIAGDAMISERTVSDVLDDEDGLSYDSKYTIWRLLSAYESEYIMDDFIPVRAGKKPKG